jgi:hypothetical protein
MRCDEYIWRIPQRIVLGKRLRIRDIKRSPTDLLFFQRGDEGF